MSTAKGCVVVGGEVVEALVVLGTVVVGTDVVEADVCEAASDVVVIGVVTVVFDEPGVASVDETSVACPVAEQATISSRDPTFNRIGSP